MEQYTFFERDYFENAGNFFFSKEHYSALLEHCFRYGSLLSFFIYENNVQFINELGKWEVKELPFDTHELGNIGKRKFYGVNDDAGQVIDTGNMGERKFYLANDETCKILSSDTAYRQLFFSNTCANPYPEDLIFLRKDGTIFFDSCFHEGEYCIYPDYGEDVSELLKYGHWLPVGDDGVPNPPAHEHQLIPLPRKEIEGDELYHLLMRVRRDPEQYLQAADIADLISLINTYRPQSFLFLSSNLASFCDSMAEMGTFLPRWHAGFRLFVLGEFGARTNENMLVAFCRAGYTESLGFGKFYELLDRYVYDICPD